MQCHRKSALVAFRSMPLMPLLAFLEIILARRISALTVVSASKLIFSEERWKRENLACVREDAVGFLWKWKIEGKRSRVERSKRVRRERERYKESKWAEWFEENERKRRRERVQKKKKYSKREEADEQTTINFGERKEKYKALLLEKRRHPSPTVKCETQKLCQFLNTARKKKLVP